MDKQQALAIWKAIRRNHPFFQSGGAFGFDFRTMVASGYERDAKVLAEAIRIASK